MVALVEVRVEQLLLLGLLVLYVNHLERARLLAFVE